MERYCMVLKIREGKKEEYINLHKNVFPEVLEELKKANIHNNSTFVTNDIIVMYLEYSSTNFWKDWSEYGQNCKVEEWFLKMKELAMPYETPMPKTVWTVLEEAFHLD